MIILACPRPVVRSPSPASRWWCVVMARLCANHSTMIWERCSDNSEQSRRGLRVGLGKGSSASYLPADPYLPTPLLVVSPYPSHHLGPYSDCQRTACYAS